MGKLVFSETGIQVHLPDPANDVDFDSRGDRSGSGGLGQRRPLAYDEKNREAWVGEPGWYHSDLYRHHGTDYDSGLDEGYFEGGHIWGRGHLEWYTDPPATHADVANALTESGFSVPNADKPRGRWTPWHEEPKDAINLEDENLWDDDPVGEPELDYWHP